CLRHRKNRRSKRTHHTQALSRLMGDKAERVASRIQHPDTETCIRLSEGLVLGPPKARTRTHYHFPEIRASVNKSKSRFSRKSGRGLIHRSLPPSRVHWFNLFPHHTFMERLFRNNQSPRHNLKPLDTPA